MRKDANRLSSHRVKSIGWFSLLLLLTLLFVANLPMTESAMRAAIPSDPVAALESPAIAADRFGSTVPQPSQADILQELSQARVVYLGETHDSLADHQAQFQILQALYDANPHLAIGLEMFQHPFQPVLDAYGEGTVTEAELRTQTEYDDRWGFPWEYYAPILQFAQTHQIPLLALNAPTEVTRQVARKGWNSLREADRQLIPPLSDLHTDNDAYRQMLQEVFEAAHQGHAGGNFENFFLVQVIWDETMADRIATFLNDHPDRAIVVLAGQGHIVYGYGIPSRVARRLGEVHQRSVLLNPSEDIQAEGTGAIADYFWLTE